MITAADKDSEPVELAAELARDRAIVSVIGDVGLDVPRRPFYEKELQLRLSRSYGPGRYDAEYEVAGRDYPIGYVRWTQRRLIAHFLEEVAAGRVAARAARIARVPARARRSRRTRRSRSRAGWRSCCATRDAPPPPATV